MSGFDLIIEKKVPISELKQAISKSLNISEDSIILTNDYVDIPFSEKIKLWCMVNNISGDFSLICQFFIRDKNIKYNKNIVSKRISYILDSKCLISDNSSNLLTWNMILPSGAKIPITLDEQDLKNDIYRLT
ncbi:hypothetical protein PT286_03435 [Neisseriaceae bacterium ESL0693]|nr:hypothetical protein [Neisseriaceae bacterium ESL0693]